MSTDHNFDGSTSAAMIITQTLLPKLFLRQCRVTDS